MNNANDSHFLHVAHQGSISGCPECAREWSLVRSKLTPDLLFAEAFKIWIGRRTIAEKDCRQSKVRYIKPRTREDYENCASALTKFRLFQLKPIGEITPDDLMDYQEARGTNATDRNGSWWCHKGKKPQGPHQTLEAAEYWAEEHGGGYEFLQTVWALPCGANHLRKEVALMVRILRDAKLWDEEQEEALLRVRTEESDVIHAMTVQEQHNFLHVAASKLSYRLIYQYAIVALQTTASTNELRALRLCDVMLADRIIQIPPAGAKNSHRFRAIPILTEDCVWALEGLIARAKSLGASQPTHYLFPARVGGEIYNPAEPMSASGLKRPWGEVRLAARMPNLRMYDLRHTGITRMAEAGVPLTVTMTFAGHMTRQMQQRYTAICMAAQRGWGASVWGDGMTRKTVEEPAGPWLAKKPVAMEPSPWNQERQRA